jgi:hypothetical protein
MSADNWTKCPHCNRKTEDAKKKVEETYGKVSAKEYHSRLQELEELQKESEDTLREDYEVGIREGEFFVNYSGFCKECNFKFNYNHSEPIK